MDFFISPKSSFSVLWLAPFFLCVPKIIARVNSRHHFLSLFYCLRPLSMHVTCSDQIHSPFSLSPINPPHLLYRFSLSISRALFKPLSPCRAAVNEHEYRVIFQSMGSLSSTTTPKKTVSLPSNHQLSIVGFHDSLPQPGWAFGWQDLVSVLYMES